MNEREILKNGVFMAKKTDSQNMNMPKLKDGSRCKVTGGTHAGKSGIVRDINTSKTGHITITVVQASGVKFKTLAKNVELT
jgi:ribosomal protein S4E